MKENDQNNGQNNDGSSESDKPQGYGTSLSQYSEVVLQKPSGYGTDTATNSENPQKTRR